MEAKTKWLSSAIEAEIIPRLLMAHRASSVRLGNAPERKVPVHPDDISEFARLVLSHDDSVALAFLEALLQRGVDLETVYLEVMAPAARVFGERWDDDTLPFTEVTTGLSRLHRLLYTLRSTAADLFEDTSGSRMLITPLPSEQHSFGLLIVADFFRHSGWNVHEVPDITLDGLEERVAATPYDVVGLSVGCERWLDELKQVVGVIRGASCNLATRILVGGHLVSEIPDLDRRVGADAVATDARQAVVKAQALVGEIARH